MNPLTCGNAVRGFFCPLSCTHLTECAET